MSEGGRRHGISLNGEADTLAFGRQENNRYAPQKGLGFSSGNRMEAPSFPRNPFLDGLLDLDTETDSDNGFAPIAPQAEVLFDPPVRRTTDLLDRYGDASLITSSDSESDSDEVLSEDSSGYELSSQNGHPVTTVDEKGVLVIANHADSVNEKGVLIISEHGGLSPARSFHLKMGGDESGSEADLPVKLLSRVRTRRESANGQGQVEGSASRSTPGVGAEGFSPANMHFQPQSANRYKPPREIPEAVFTPVASEFREAQEIMLASPQSALSPEGQRLAAAWTEQALREGEARDTVAWAAISNSSLISRPLPEEVGTVLCYIVREKDSLYRLYTQQGIGRPDRLLLIAREHRRGGKTEFTISSSLAGIKTRSKEDGFVGTVNGNLMGTRFEVSEVRDDQERRPLGVTTFQGSVKKVSGDYRRMTVTVPKPVLVTSSEATDEAPVGSLALPEAWDAQEGSSQTANLTTKVPYMRRVNGVTQHYLPYHGRCRLPSVKNFQLVYENDQEHVVLMFGKDSKHTYCMDYSWPLTAYQAFGISLASIATKLCYAL